MFDGFFAFLRDIFAAFPRELNLLESFNLIVAGWLFILCAMPEAIGISVPWMLEGTWLLAGSQLKQDGSYLYLGLYILVAQCGRLFGATILYRLSVVGSVLIERYFGRFMPKAKLNIKGEHNLRYRLLNNVNLLSAFSVALGRLLWLRVPLTILLGAMRRYRTLVWGILISGLLWDMVYICLGSFFGTAIAKNPLYLLLFFFSIVASGYALNISIRFLIHSVSIRKSIVNEPDTDESKNDNDKPVQTKPQ